MELGTYITTRGNEAIKELRKEIGPEALIQTDKAYQTTMKNIEKNYENIKTAIIEALPYLHPEDIITLRDTCTVTRFTIIGKKYDMTTEQMKDILDNKDESNWFTNLIASSTLLNIDFIWDASTIPVPRASAA